MLQQYFSSSPNKDSAPILFKFCTPFMKQESALIMAADKLTAAINQFWSLQLKFNPLRFECFSIKHSFKSLFFLNYWNWHFVEQFWSIQRLPYMLGFWLLRFYRVDLKYLLCFYKFDNAINFDNKFQKYEYVRQTKKIGSTKNIINWIYSVPLSVFYAAQLQIIYCYKARYYV